MLCRRDRPIKTKTNFGTPRVSIGDSISNNPLIKYTNFSNSIFENYEMLLDSGLSRMDG
jgi:hypothetical protein